uniref:Protein-arginine deiminase n=1 Tax=Melopsittacus undulatus TaxID=13146 RepID=A0A8V5GBW8_MELUD
MAQQRRVQLSTQRPTSTVCVLGTELSLDVCGSAPKDAVTFHVQGTPGVKVYVVHDTQSIKMPSTVSRWPLAAGAEVLLSMDALSKDVGDEKVGFPISGRPVGCRTPLPAEVSLDADTTRSGTVSRTLLDKATWTWGPDGHGAILLVNCDRDDPTAKMLDNSDTAIRSYDDLKDMSQMVLRTRGPRTIFTGHRLILHIDYSDADKVGVFYGSNSAALEEYKHVLGGSKLAYTIKHSQHQEESIFYVEGLAFPDVDFSGLVAFHVTLLESSEKGLLEAPIFMDTVVFRMAPWIMTPNTAAPLEVFVCRWVLESQVPAHCVPDEVEFGYVQAPHKTFPVVFDSPRDRGLKDFPVKSILGPDFGYVARQAPEGSSSLDSFGNLEVSPPLTVQGKEYPLGRILIGSSFPRFGGRRMAKAVKDFLIAQKVQAPVELFSDWLAVGHVDEFLSFVPAPDRKGFRLLLASPSACYQLLKEKQEEGFGEAAMFHGRGRWKTGLSGLIFPFFLQNSCINWNRDILKRSLGLSEPDIIDIPQLFRGDTAHGAEAFFPDMVNMLVLGRHLGIPKPFGPQVGGQCCLEERVRALLEPLGLTCTFIDDYFSYHVLSGDVHCGTNVRRKPFAFKWWHMVP